MPKHRHLNSILKATEWRWWNSRGEQVAKTEGGKLVFLKKKDPRAVEDPAKKMAKGGEDVQKIPNRKNQRQQHLKKQKQVMNLVKEQHLKT